VSLRVWGWWEVCASLADLQPRPTDKKIDRIAIIRIVSPARRLKTRATHAKSPFGDWW
jgi:hypothetical protein